MTSFCMTLLVFLISDSEAFGEEEEFPRKECILMLLVVGIEEHLMFASPNADANSILALLVGAEVKQKQEEGDYGTMSYTFEESETVDSSVYLLQ